MVPASTAADGQGRNDLEPVAGPAASFDSGRYIVLLKDPSAAQYGGSDPDFAATRVAPGEPFRGRSDDGREYTNLLEVRQDQLARSVNAQVDSHFTVATNGFAAELTGRQAFKLSSDGGVLLVTEDVPRQVDTWNTPDFLGLSGERANGPTRAAAAGRRRRCRRCPGLGNLARVRVIPWQEAHDGAQDPL